ncbi:MAG: hypothetical protein DWI24_06100 [Planctomycetota bacterium]|nr:MAG: hypothetical protein DWI24_06100 [Planctomycetota bacterium]
MIFRGINLLGVARFLSSESVKSKTSSIRIKVTGENGLDSQFLKSLGDDSGVMYDLRDSVEKYTQSSWRDFSK